MTVIMSARIKVLAVREKTERRHVRGHGADAVFREVSLGWQLLLAGSREGKGSFLVDVGEVRPATEAGRFVRIDISETP